MNLTPDRSSNTESLDPDDWEEFRRIAYLAVDDMIADLQSVQEHAAWQEVPELTKCKLDEPIPWKGQPLSEVYAEFSERIRPYPTGNAHPRFFGWVVGNGTPTGALADFLASWMNAHVAGCSQSATVIEEKVLSWLKELMGYPTKSSGLLVSGGTMANINALIVARNSLLRTGVCREQQKPDNLTIYGSSETHNWIMKACEVMGIGTNAFRAVPVNDRFQVDCTSLEESIEQDIRQGFRPLCIIGNVGTVNTGAIDDIARLRQIADRFGVWLHVDGAFGSMAAWGPDPRIPLIYKSRNIS